MKKIILLLVILVPFILNGQQFILESQQDTSSVPITHRKAWLPDHINMFFGLNKGWITSSIEVGKELGNFEINIGGTLYQVISYDSHNFKNYDVVMDIYPKLIYYYKGNVISVLYSLKNLARVSYGRYWYIGGDQFISVDSFYDNKTGLGIGLNLTYFY